MGAIRRSKTKRRTRSVSLSSSPPHHMHEYSAGKSRRIQANAAPPYRDLDQVHADLRSPKQLTQHKTAKPAEDLPGLGQWYCVECAKWFEGENSLVQHRRGKNHKRRSVWHSPYCLNFADADMIQMSHAQGRAIYTEGG